MPDRSTLLFRRLRAKFLMNTSPLACYCFSLKRWDSSLSSSRSRSPRMSTLSSRLSTLKGFDWLGTSAGLSWISFLEVLIDGKNSDL